MSHEEQIEKICEECGADVDLDDANSIVDYHNDETFEAFYFCDDECHCVHGHKQVDLTHGTETATL